MSVLHAPTYHWTVEEYERLGEAGFFVGKPRVELLNGEIITMSPIGYRHAEAVARLNEFFVQNAKRRYKVRPQLPIIIDQLSEPEPDLSLIAPTADTVAGHPKPRDVFLVIEVSDSTIRYDRENKRAAYARNGVREFWLLNLQTNQLEAYAEPVGDQYRVARMIDIGGTVAPLAFPDVELRVREVIP